MDETFHESFAAEARPAAEARERFARFCAGRGVPEEAAHDVSLALQEILDNVVEHGYAGAPGEIRVEARVDEEGSVSVSVCDRGPAFDPLAEPVLAIPPAERPGGLGLRLARALVDAMRWERRDGENRLVLLKLAPRRGGTMDACR